MLTRRGWVVLGAGAGLYLSARVLGLVQLAVLGVAAFALLGAALAWVQVARPSLSGRRQVKERLQVGLDGRVDLVVEASRGRTPTLVVTDVVDGGRRAARFLLAPLHAAEHARAAYRFPTDRRGRFEVGPLRATVTDPFGLVRRAERVLGAEHVLVHPRVHDVLPPPEAGGHDLDREQPHVHARVEPSGEFLTLREYAPGDDLRHVHWRSTAHRGRLMVRQNEARRRAPVLVVLDVRPGGHDRASFERAVEACASVVSALDRAGRPVEVLASTAEVIGTPGRRHLATVMDELAVVQPHGPDRIVVARTRRRTSALVAVMGRMRHDEPTAIGALLRTGGLLTVVATAAGAAVAAPRRGRFRAIVVPHGADRPFPHAWNEEILRWQRSARPPRSASLVRP